MSDLEELFSRLKTQQQPQACPNAVDIRASSIWDTQTPSAPHPPVQGLTPAPTRHVMPRGATEQTMSNNLLTLLNINRPQANVAPQRPASVNVGHSNGKDALSVGTSLLRQPSESAAMHRFTSGAQSSATPDPPADTQRFLLDLLTKPNKVSESAQSLPKTPDLMQTDQSMIDKLAQSFSNKPQHQSSAVATTSKPPPLASTSSFASAKATTPQPEPLKAGLFNYVNPFDQLHASSPLNLPPSTRPEPVETSSEQQESISVSQKLESIGESIGKDVEKALAQATKSKDEEVTSNWSTAEDEDAKKEEDDKVEAYNFPMKPFVMLELQQSHVPRSFRSATWTNATPVARLKKEFSHDDRTLATASQNHIIYTVVPTEKKPASGLKVIRQDDGKNKQLWSITNERLCSVQISAEGSDTVLATGVNGTIFYTELPPTDGVAFDETDVEANGFVMTPPPNSDEPTTGSFATSAAIRTRAKLSNNNPSAYFAVARGRQIHLIAPSIVKRDAYRNPTTYRVDTDKLLSDASFSINTGKAGKDFCFSEDDTILVSLDKLGKVKFWDIRVLTTGIESFADKPSKIEIKEPVFSFSAGAAPSKSDDKMSPSSIIFIDKERAYTKSVALRYLLIGYQQNHIIQLWDLGLGKCVQELRFPESTESPEDGSAKGMCSITYHPKTAIICIGHPGRNSVYFLHLSAPKYSLPPMDQAMFLSYIARGDRKNLPAPDSTAIMSGIREFSCSRVGQLRSLDVLKTPYSADTQTQATDDEVLFELYLMHSKGVLVVPTCRADLGWDAKGKLVKSANAVDRGVVVVHELKAYMPAEEKSSQIVTPVKPASKPKKEEKTHEKTHEKPPMEQPVMVESIANRTAAASVPRTATPEKPCSPAESAVSNAQPTPVTVTREGLGSQASKINQSIITPDSYKMTYPQRASSSNSESGKSIVTELNGKSTDNLSSSALSEHFTSLYSKLESDRRVAEATGAAKQDAMLRLVSSTLTDNVEASLHKIVSASIEQQVLPALTNQVLSSVDRSFSQGLQKLLPPAIQQQVKASIPDAIHSELESALHDTSFIRAIAAETAKQLDDKIKTSIHAELQHFQAAVQAKIEEQHVESKKFLEKQVEQGIAQARSAEEKLNNFDQNTLKAMHESEQRIAQLLSVMQAEQSRLAARLDSLQQPVAPDTPQTVHITKEEPSEVQRLTQLLNDGNFEQATIEWLQSSEQAQLFDDLFVRINPAYLQHVSPLIALSVSAAVTSSFDSNVAKRLEWLGSVLDNMDINDPEIRDVIPKIMDVLIQRLQGAYMQIAESQPTDQDVLRKLASLNRHIGDIRKSLP